MKRKKVINSKNFQSRMPLFTYATIWLLLDRFHPSLVWYGVAYTLISLSAFSVIYGWCTEERVDIFEGK